MGVTLAKGGNVSLSKEAPNLTSVSIGLGWDVRSTTGGDFDLDASAIGLGPDKKSAGDLFFVFYNNLRSPDGAIEHTGDNRTGEGEGDDESINVDLVALSPEIDSIIFPVSIHDADVLGQNFGQVASERKGAVMSRRLSINPGSASTKTFFSPIKCTTE